MCVLLVEDDPAICSVVSEALREDGFDLVEATDGEAGIAYFEREPQRFSILITNVQLPGIVQGGDVAAHVRVSRPEIPIVIASGAPEALQKRWDTEDGFIVLTKPYRLHKLSTLVHSLTQRIRIERHEPVHSYPDELFES